MIEVRHEQPDAATRRQFVQHSQQTDTIAPPGHRHDDARFRSGFRPQKLPQAAIHVPDPAQAIPSVHPVALRRVFRETRF
jgi:hypothetical protein